MMAALKKHSALLLGALALTACDSGKFELDDNKAVEMSKPIKALPCADNNPQRNAYFGDFHVHTGYSTDGWKFGVRTTPQDAYRYAFGGEIFLAPNDAAGEKGTRPVRIDRPLDFMAVTDHSEYYAEGRICTDERYEGYNTEYCADFRKAFGRDFLQAAALIAPFTWRNTSVCGDNGELCKVASGDVWKDTIQAAEDWNDTSENCERTTFVGYEYSSVRLGSNLHRNVIFRNTTIPPHPISTIEAPRDWQLWEGLKRDCLDAGNGCDVLAIPHNPNISNGRMFSVDYPGTDGSIEEQRAHAQLRIELEPIVEVMQHKGDSECRRDLPGVLGAVDELCDFEKFEDFAFETTGVDDPEACREDWLADMEPNIGPSCVSRLSYIRTTLIEGLKEEERLGVNPFKFGLSASTDTHNGVGGAVNEQNFPGHLGLGDDTIEKRTAWKKEVAGNANNNPGGLIGVWSEENSRDSLFDAMKRKEVFGTSGPRIQPRFFGGWNLDAALCEDPEMLKKAYAQGVAMGGDLPSAKGEAKAPSFLVSALADTGTTEFPATPLQRLQIVKGWVDDEGVSHEKVFEVAGNPDNGASVNLNNCQRSGEGYTQLCSVWKDPEFDASRRAVYYMRAVENPSCRYTAWQCSSLAPEDRPADCSDPKVKKAIQERAWTSPIWYGPGQ